MLDAFPAVRVPSFETYADGLSMVLDSEGDEEVFSASVLAVAVRHVLANCKFTPTIAEVLAAAKLAKKAFAKAYYEAEQLLILRESAENLLVHVGGDEDIA